ncbi:MAG: DUF4783 domain-containing protein [Bacteroidales bacterium]|jgi:hypothetical protein|nr:DUF4783 domain-containing protein [Bacteroidales bacterium]
MLCFNFTIYAQHLKLPSDIVTALETGNTKELCKRFNTSVDLILNQSQNVYGKSQAEKILKSFFDTNGPSLKYKELHSSGKDISHCNFIGQLYTSKGVYRVYIYIKNGQIYQMRFESND